MRGKPEPNALLRVGRPVLVEARPSEGERKRGADAGVTDELGQNGIAAILIFPPIGAAHAGCFTMALSLILGEAKLTAEQMETKADVTLEKQGDGFAITAVHLTLTAKIPGADKAKFDELTAMAKAGCPVSKLLNTKITLDATLL